MRNKRMKQIWACLLTALLLFSQAGTGAYAKGTQGEKDTGGLCGHHLAHTQDCGYTEGSPCGHEHDENCYSLVTKCVYEEEGGDATPSDAEEQKHECSEERDCIKRVLDCRHTHDETCGYEKAHLCRYVCDICGGKAGSVPDENRGLEGETPDADCICETRCIRYLVNGDCPVCAENEKDCRGAKEPVIEGGTVMAFSRLGRAVEKQEVKAGTALEKLKLPHSLEASVYSEDEADDGDTVTAVYIEVLSWNSEPAYEGEPGTYVFTPEPAEDYPLQNGVALPNITVTVVKREDVCICTALCGEEFANGDCPVCKEAYGRCAFSERGETEAAKEVCALIDALPTVERIYDDVVGDSDPAYEKWLADMKGTLKQIGEAGACFDRLGVQEKEFVGQERAGKLENLRDFADRLGQRAILAVGQSFTEGNLEYQVTSAEPAEVDVIGYYGRIGTLDSLEIPGEATGTSAVYNVTGIGDSVFSNCYSLTELTLPDGMKRIGNSAFSNCYSLEELTLPDTLERIGESAFLNC
ncbi:MAG: leucine-rich repeat domain-containing protein, partial [Clostridium sp.]|nr:leucine-rich repeat domain-containing protein [Clostridium sp.]